MPDLPITPIAGTKFSVETTKALVFCVVFAGVCALIAFDKLTPDYLKYLLAWLIPGPLTLEKDNAK